MPRRGGGAAGAGGWAGAPGSSAHLPWPGAPICPGAKQPGAKGNRPSPTPPPPQLGGRPLGEATTGSHEAPTGWSDWQRAGKQGSQERAKESPPSPPHGTPPQACRVRARGQGLQPLPPSPARARAVGLHRALPHFTLAQLLSWTIASQLQGAIRRLRGAGARPRPLRAAHGRGWVCAAVSRSPPPRAPGRARAWSRSEGHLCVRRGPLFPPAPPRSHARPHRRVSL